MKTKSAREYDAMVQKASPRSPVLKDCLFAFLFGGAICTLGQGLADLFMLLGFTLHDARTFVSISLIFLSAALTAFGVYDNIAKYAGAGTLVPITGFANSMVSPRWSSKARASSPASARRCSSSPARCWCSAFRPRCFTASFCT